MQNNYDVIILGGGLAGLTLAMQMRQQEPTISIAILEMRAKAAPEAAHKVGESTVELGTYYLREVLGLKDYLEAEHLQKHGLRFFFSPDDKEHIERRVEYGARYRLHIPSHQIDRGVFENEMIERLSTQMDVDVMLGARVKDVVLDKGEDKHIVTFSHQKQEKRLTADWVVDATGRASFLKRKLGFEKEVPHEANAVWFRVKGDVDVDDWSTNQDWTQYLEKGLRRLSTIHLMDKGYWVWLIPLSTGHTSVGIVADPRFHPFNSFNTLDKAFEWLEKNEPQCAAQLSSKKEDVLDFRRLKDYAYHSGMFYSNDKWGVVGEAGAFLDPFYSPGTDFIALGNTWMSDLVLRSYRKEDIHSRAIIYNQVHSRLFDNWIPIYKDKYELFGNAQLMTFKITWDWAVYWGIPTLLFTNNGLTNLNVLKKIFTTPNCLGQRFGQLNANVQDFFLEWGRMENEHYKEIYVDPIDVPFMKRLHRELDVVHSSDSQLLAQLESNITDLEKMAAEMFRVVSNRLKDTHSQMPVNPYKMSLSLDKEQLIEQGENNGRPYDKEVADDLEVLWLYEKTAV